MTKTLKFNLNGKDVEVLADVRESLYDLIRDKLQLTGTKQGCGVGECGACTLIVDGNVIDSCIYLAVWADGRKITSIEGITADDGSLSDVQQAFVDGGAVQCGYCTPGLVLSTTALLEKNANPTRAEIRRGLSGNLCRCTGYQKIIESVESTAKMRNK